MCLRNVKEIYVVVIDWVCGRRVREERREVMGLGCVEFYSFLRGFGFFFGYWRVSGWVRMEDRISGRG